MHADYHKLHQQVVYLSWFAIICLCFILALAAAWHDARRDALEARENHDELVDIALKRERLIEAQAKMIRNKPVRAKIVYRELP